MARFSVRPVLSKGGTIGPHKVMEPQQKSRSTVGSVDLLNEYILAADKVGTQVYHFKFLLQF